MNPMESDLRTPLAQPRSLVRALVAGLPTFVVLFVLGAVGWWGHGHDWRAPKLAELFGAAPPTQAEDWCDAHNVPDSRCVACHPELVGEDPAGWCTEHGVPESKCTACHPEILKTGVAGDWCAEHGLPESGCTVCHPELAHKGELEQDESSARVTSGAHEHERDEDHPAGLPQESRATLRDSRTCQKHALRVQFASAAALRKCGVSLGAVVERPMSDSLLANAEVDYDRTRFARLAPRVAGTAWRVERSLGDVVRAGDVLAWIEAPEIARAKSELLRAQSELEQSTLLAQRADESSAAGFRTETERLEAQARARAAEIRLFDARQALASLGLDAPQRVLDAGELAALGSPPAGGSGLPAAGGSASLSPLVAPFDGLVVARDVVMGERVDPSRALFEIADTSRLWVTMDVPEAEAHRVTLDEEVLFRPDDARDEVVVGRVTWIAAAVDELTRTVKMRADVRNSSGGLRAHSFGRAQIVVRTSAQAIAVPTEAVQWEGCCFVVFVRTQDALFQTRKVRLGAKDAAYTEVLGGLLPGEIVATAGSHVLKSEILKSNLGAGCTDE